MVAVGALSIAANGLRSLLVSHIDDLAADQIMIGHPKETFEKMDQDKNYLNLFFYNVQYDGYPADAATLDPFYVRMYCLITAAAGANSTPSPGENDLRLVGEVLRVVHQHPTIMVSDDGDDEIAELQIVPHPLNLDNLNHIWSTQGDTAYRLSVAYELALAPVPLAVKVERSQRVGILGIEARGTMDALPLPKSGFIVQTFSLPVQRVTVNTELPEWSAHICLVNPADGSLTYTLSLQSSAIPASPAALSLQVLIAGKIGETVSLVFETWSTTDGWQRADTPETATVQTGTIDPDAVNPGLAESIDLPLWGKGQATLYAERSYERADGSITTLRSNPLLVIVTEVNA